MKSITVDQLKEKMDAGESIHLLDVREPNEYAEFNIGAQLFPLGRIQAMDIADLEGWENDEVIIHCRSGKRSATACLFLESLGFKNTVNVEGGMLAWQQKFGS
jgi:rhodanese-related sulfurtransferase